MAEIKIVNPNNELLNKTFSEAAKSYNVVMLAVGDGRTHQPFVKLQIYGRYIEIENDITVLRKMLVDKDLTAEEIKAVESAIKALSDKQVFFSPESITKRNLGIQKAKESGKYKGRKPIEIDKGAFEEEYTRYMHREITKGELAEKLQISRPTLDKIIKKTSNHI